MKKSTYKKKKTQRIDKMSDKHHQYYDLAARLLSTAGLNRFEVNKRIKIDEKADDVIDLEIDLHRLTTDETEIILLKLLNSRALKIKTMTLIHGFNHGIILKDYLKYDFSSDRISAKSSDSINPGITILKIKPWGKNKSKYGQGIKQKAKKENREVKYKCVPGIEEEKNDARFKLEMIKENVKASNIKSKNYNDIFSSVLTDKEKEYSEAIFNYNFDLNVFLNNLVEFYIFDEIIHIKIRYKKKAIDEVINLVEKVTAQKEDKKFVIMIEVSKDVMKQMKNGKNFTSKMYYKCDLDDWNLLISNMTQ